MTPVVYARSASAAAIALALTAAPASAQQALPTIDVGARRAPSRPAPRAAARPAPRVVAAPAPAPTPVTPPPGFSPEKKALPVYREPTGQTFTSVATADLKGSPLSSVRDVLQYSPGVSFKEGNSAWDTMISIRGSTARFGFAIRNIVMLEDGFSVTPPSGFSRTDGVDPHSYAAFDVYRGPSSALFGNFANGGAVLMRTRSGAEIDGVETGHEFGSFGNITNYVAVGKNTGPLDVSAFFSDRRTDGFINHFDGDTQNVNFLATYRASPTDRLVLKINHSELFANQSPRLSLNQFFLNPYQRGCALLPPTATAWSSSWCGQASLFANGVTGARVQSSANVAGFHRNDRRDIVGLRWEHDIDAQTVLRTQVVYDDGNINQPTGATSALSDSPAITASTDVTRHGGLFGRDSTTMFGAWFSKMKSMGYTANVSPIGDGAPAAITATTNAMQQNLGARGRQEVALSDTVTGVLGFGVEMSRLAALQNTVNYGAPTSVSPPWIAIPVNHTYWNFAPEASLVWRPDKAWTTHVRASSGYGSPYYSQLFVTANGVPGDNSSVTTQRNTGLDVGVDWTPRADVRASVTLFHEWYQNEQLSQTPGAGLLSYTFNAPGSVHRGVETAFEWRPLDGWRILGNYSYNNQIFTNFTEQLGTSSGPAAQGWFNRAGNKIPGVAPHELTARLAYDQPSGPFRNLGGYVEYVYKSSYYLDNANLLTAPSFGIVNLNIHYERELQESFLKKFSLFFEVRNVFDRSYVASANNITNSVSNIGGVAVQNPSGVLAQNATGAIYAGSPRAFQGGVKFKF